jgi:O-antigen/teichoic acid export membrane protein
MTLQAILSMWACAEVLGFLFTAILLARARLLPTRWYGIDRNWLLKGLRVGTHYTALGLLLIVSFSVQRVALGHLLDGQAVGIFHFFFVISVFGPNLLEASLFAIYLPRLIANSASRKRPALQFPSRLSLALLAGGGAVGLAVLYAILPIFTRMLGKPELLAYGSLFAFTATYALLYTVARAFHYSLYAAQADRWLLKVNAAVCSIACVTSFVFVSYFGLQGAGWSLLLSGFLLLAGNCLPFLSESVRDSVIGKNSGFPK